MFFNRYTCEVPADVPNKSKSTYCQNYATLTKNSHRLMLMACDQKMEHLNNDFYGPHIHPDTLHPEHMFKIAQQGAIGAFATHLGLIARYGLLYPKIPYIAKLNGKTDLLTQQDPFSQQLWHIQDVMRLKDAGLNIPGVGYTIYLGSSYEAAMLSQAASIISQAHEQGLITILWIYVRGTSITDELDPTLAAGAAGLAASLGSDFVKIKPPHDAHNKTSTQWLSIARAAAGNTKIICAGGDRVAPETFFNTLYEQLNVGGIAGSATGRNIFQHSLADAVAMTRAISAMVYNKKNAEQALKLYQDAKK